MRQVDAAPLHRRSRPDSGSIAIADTEITGLSVSDMAVFRRRSIGLIYQFFNLIPSLTILQVNITLPLSLDGREPEREYFYALTNSPGIEGLLGRYPSQLSGGQQQRCAIARALMAKPAICLADEPTGNLDRKNTEEVIKLFREMKERFGQTILMVTHDSSLLGYGDRTVLMEDGLVISDVAARV